MTDRSAARITNFTFQQGDGECDWTTQIPIESARQIDSRAPSVHRSAEGKHGVERAEDREDVHRSLARWERESFANKQEKAIFFKFSIIHKQILLALLIGLSFCVCFQCIIWVNVNFFLLLFRIACGRRRSPSIFHLCLLTVLTSREGKSLMN